MKIELTAEEHTELSEDDAALYVQPEGSDVFILKDVYDYGEDRAEKVHSALVKERERVKKLEKSSAPDEALQRENRELKKTAAISAAIEEADGIPKLLRGHLSGVADFDSNGQLVILSTDGKPMLTEDGDNVSLSYYTKGLREDPDFQPMFRAQKRAGTPPKSTTPAARKTQPRLEQMSRQQKVDFLKTKRADGLSYAQAEAELFKLGATN